MAEESDSVDNSAGPAYYQPTTTPEAQVYARKILDKQIGGGNQKGEAAILDEMQANSQRAIQALQRAQQSMAGVQYDPRPNQAAVAGALLAPTHSGSTSEGLGKAFEQVGAGQTAQRNFELERLKAVLDYQQRIAEAPDAITKTKLELQKLHEQQEGPMGKEALTVLGRSIVPGAGLVSPNGKVAVSEGYQVNTPAYHKRVNQLDAIDRRNKAATAGTDEDVYQEPDHSDQAYQYGVPATAPYPWASASTKERKQMLNTERTSAEKELSVGDSGVQQAQAIQRDLSRFKFLNKRTATSSLQGVPGIHFITGFGDDAKEMDKISSRLGPLMRQPGMGRMTNYDLQTFMAATVGRDKPKAVNDSIETAMKTAIDNQLGYNTFSHNYFAVHRTLQGARESWDDYLNKNPIFDPTAEEGSFKINPGRVDWKIYFRSQHPQGHEPGEAMDKAAGPSQFPDVTEDDRNDPVFAGMSDEQIHGAKMPAKARGGPIRGYAGGGKVKADDDYQATLADLARAVEQGGTFKWGDELNAAVSPGSYSDNVTSERGKQERFAASHPYSNFGLEAGGGAAAGMAAGKLGSMALAHAKGKAGALGALASLVSRYTPARPGLRMAATGALAGGASGALSGAGAAQDISSIPGMAAEQGTIGTLVGPLAGLATKYGVNGVMALVDKLRGKSVPAGARKVLAALEQDKTTADEVATRLRTSQRLGVPSTVGDVGGPNTSALAQGVATKPGERVGNYVEQLSDRQQGSNTRVQDLVNKALKPDDYTTKLKDLTTQLYQGAKPLYDQAYAQFPRVKSNTIFEILGTPSGKKAGKAAYKLMEDAGIPIGQPDVSGMIKKPSLQYLDYVKRALDDQIEKAQRGGNLNQARVIKDMRNKLRDELDVVTADPKGGQSLYAQARQQYAGDAEVLDALKMGRDQFGNMSARDLTEATKNMSWAEKDALRTGAAESLFQTVGSTPLSSNPAQKLANTGEIQAKLSALFDTPAEANKFMAALQQEMSNFNQSRTILGTAARSRAARASADLEPSGGLGEAAYETTLAGAGHPLWAGARAAKWMGNKLMSNPTADQAADILGTGAGGQSTLAMLKAQAAQLAARQGTGNLAGMGAATATGPTLAPEPWGNVEQQ